MSRFFLHHGKPYDFNKIARRFQVLKTKLPRDIADEVVRFSRQRFKAQAWTDKGAQKWAPRKNADKGRAILVKSGRLRNSVRVMNSTFTNITVGSSLPYAAAHNFGFKGTVNVKSHKRDTHAKTKVYDITKMNIKNRSRSSKTIRVRTGSTTVKAHSRRINLPQRQFLGESEYLERRLDKIIINQIDKIF